MGRARHTHALDRVIQQEFWVYAPNGHERTGDKVTEDVRVGACGYEIRASWDTDRTFDANPNNVTCPACNKKLAAAAIKARPADAPRLEIIADKAARGGFRHNGGSQVRLDGEVIGYVGFEDHCWRIYPLQIERYDEQAEASGPYVRNTARPLKEDGSCAPRGFYNHLGRDVLSFKSKEAAAMGCETAYRAGLIKTGPELFTEAEKDAAEALVARAQRQALKAERQTAKDETLLALHEILDKETLSNFQRQGLMNAIALVEKQHISGYDDL